MAKNLTSTLKADLPALAEMIRSKGRGRDTILAHITPKEAALLKSRGGRGSVNPYTGLPEYEDDVGDYGGDIGPVADVSPVYDVIDSGGGFTQYAPGGETAYTPGGQDYAPYIPYYDGGGGDYAPAPDQAVLQQQAAALLPGLGGSVEEPLASSRTFAAANRDLYPGGELPPEGYGTIYTPRGEATYAPQENIDKWLESFGMTKEDKDKIEEETKKSGKSWWETAAQMLAAGLIGLGLTNRQKQAATSAATQAKQAAQEVKAIAAPYQIRGTGLMRAAEQGQLSAANQQIVNAARAQAAQNIRRRGGVGVLQYANSIADLTDRLLQSQFNQGLAVSQIGDNYALQAIKTGLAGDQAVVQANAGFYGQLAQMLSPYILGSTGVPAQRQTGLTG